MITTQKQLQQRNAEREKQITAENDTVYTPILMYLRGSHIPEYNQECIRQDLIDMTLSAQERNESLKTIIGEDYKHFCDEIIAAFKRDKRKQFFDFLTLLFHSLFFLGLISIITSPKTIPLIEKTVNEKKFDFQYTLPFSLSTLTMFITITGIAFFVVYFIMKNAFKNKRFVIIVSSISIGSAVALLIISYFFFGQFVLFNINFLIACFIVVLFYILSKMFDVSNK